MTRTRLQTVAALENELELADRAEADQRAVRLLKAHLTRLQWIDYKATIGIEVKGSHHTYRVSGAGATILTGKFKGKELCISPKAETGVGYRTMRLPYADLVLTMKLWVEANEEEFLKIANPTWAPYHRMSLTDELVVAEQYRDRNNNRVNPRIYDPNLYRPQGNWFFQAAPAPAQTQIGTILTTTNTTNTITGTAELNTADETHPVAPLMWTER
jgi:hypothetical protein